MSKARGREQNKMELFEVPEEEVAERMGVPRECVRELRVENLYQEEDWALLGGVIRYSRSGMKRLEDLLKKNAPGQVRWGDLSLGRVGRRVGEKNAATGILDAVVTRVFKTNPGFMEAELGGQVVTVRVRSNLNFLEGMIIPSRELLMKNTRLFDFVGRLPRQRGRW